jgi:hypothetical protein
MEVLQKISLKVPEILNELPYQDICSFVGP